MKIVFYSSNANRFDGTLTTTHLPALSTGWQTLAKKHPEHEFIIVAQKPGAFLLDTDGENIIVPSSVETHILSEELSASKVAEAILEIKPDIAIAESAWGAPFDWLSLQDAEIARILRSKGVKVVCHNMKSALDCFDKRATSLRLSALGIGVAKSVFVNHALFVSGGNRKELCRNVYRDAVLSEIKAMHYPVVIKDTTGLSSYGMEVSKDFESAKVFLHSKRNNSDRIVEEYIEGEQFGIEIYGSAETSYTVFPPFKFSVNAYGITSPKQSIKIGPIADFERYKLNDLFEMMGKIAREFNFEGIAQVDLVFSKGKWYVIEINPRLSGMSQTYAASLGFDLAELMYNAALCDLVGTRQKKALNIKFPLLSNENLLALKAKPYVFHIAQTENKAAKQEREKGYCEVILTASDFPALSEALEDLASSFPLLVENAFVQTAREMLKDLL